MTGNRKEHLWKEKIMKIRKTICSLLLVCLAFLGIFCGRANVYACLLYTSDAADD